MVERFSDLTLKSLLSLGLVIAICLGVFNYITGFRSAFEADQACHSELSIKYMNEKNFGCDHDTETKQWILYKKGIDQMPAIVLRRFSY